MTRQYRNYLQRHPDTSFPRRRESSSLFIFLDSRLRGNDGSLFGRAFLRTICLFVTLSFSLAVAAQGEKTLVLTNYNTDPIWMDTVLYGDEEFPAGYLPPKGRIYLRLGTQQVRTLLLRWHKTKAGEQEQQTIRIDPAFNVEHKKARYFIFAYVGESFIQLQSK